MKPASTPPRRRPSLTRPAKATALLKVADEVWIAAALLHREHPERPDFTVEEIIERVQRESITGKLRPGVRVYALLHCVANYPPNPARYRVLFATGDRTRRLFREGDPYNLSRDGSQFMPRREDAPARYLPLLDWYAADYSKRRVPAEQDSILALRGLGKELWADEDPDEYVRRLREDWD